MVAGIGWIAMPLDPHRDKRMLPQPCGLRRELGLSLPGQSRASRREVDRIPPRLRGEFCPHHVERVLDHGRRSPAPGETGKLCRNRRGKQDGDQEKLFAHLP